MFLYQTKKQKQEKAKIQTSKETVEEGRGKEICQFESCERESVIDRKS